MRAGWATVGESRGWLVRGWAAAGRREQDDQGMGTRRGAKAPDPAQWGPGEDLRPEPAVRRAPTSLGSGAQVGTQVGTRAATGRTTGPGLPVARALLPRAVFGEGTAREPSPGPPRTGAGPPAALRVSGLPPPAGSPSWAPCPKPVQSRDRPVGIGRPVSPSSRGQWCAAEWPRAPALPARKKLDHPSRQRKRALPCFPRRLRQARARCAVRSGAGWGSPRKRRARARKRLRLSRCLCFFGAARPPGQLAFPLLSARLSSKAFPRQLWGTREMCSRTESRPQSHHPVEAAVFYCISFHFTSFHFVSFRFVSFSSKEAVFSGYCVSLLPRDLDLLLFITQRYISENRCHVSCHFTEKQGRRTASNVAVSLDWKVQ